MFLGRQIFGGGAPKFLTYVSKSGSPPTIVTTFDDDQPRDLRDWAARNKEEIRKKHQQQQPAGQQWQPGVLSLNVVINSCQMLKRIEDVNSSLAMAWAGLFYCSRQLDGPAVWSLRLCRQSTWNEWLVAWLDVCSVTLGVTRTASLQRYLLLTHSAIMTHSTVSTVQYWCSAWLNNSLL